MHRILFIALWFNLGLAQEAPSSNIVECDMEIPKFSAQTCGDASFFMNEEGPKNIKIINEAFQEKMNKLWSDNQTHPDTMVDLSIKGYRIYNQCFNKLCQNIITHCSDKQLNTKPNTQFEWCQNRQQKLRELQKSQITYLNIANINRKHRSLLEEKINAITYRMHQYLNPLNQKVNSLMDVIRGKIDDLVKYPST